MVDSQNSVDIVHALGPRVGQLLDLGGSVLDLLVGHVQLELISSGLDGAAKVKGGTANDQSQKQPRTRSVPPAHSLPTGQSVSDRDVSAHTKVLGLQDLVRRRVGKDSLGVNTSLVGEGTESGNVVVAVPQANDPDQPIHSPDTVSPESWYNLQGNGNLNGLGDQVLDLSQHGQVVLGLDVLRVGDHHPRDQSTKGGDSVSLTDTQDRGIDVSSTGFESGVGVGDGTSRVVVEMTLDVTADDASEGPDEIVDLSRVGTSDGIGYTDTVETDLVDRSVDAQQVDQVGSEGIFGRESDLNVLGLDVFNDFDGLLGDPGHVLSVRVFSEERRGTDDDVDTVNTRLDGETGVVHVTSNVGENPRGRSR
jgi:hypothetical protein